MTESIPEGMTVLDLTEKLRAEMRALKVIISSGYSSETNTGLQSAAQGIVILPKPYTLGRFSKAVRECLDRA